MAILTNINDLFTVNSSGEISFNRIGGSTTTGYTFPALDGTANYILKTNGDGVLSWVPDASGGVTGSGSNGQATFWTGTSSVSGDNDFFWDNTNKRLGIGTNVPSAALEVKVANPRVKVTATTGTNPSYLNINNTGGSTYAGQESSVAGSEFTGTTAYASVFGSSSSRNTQFLTNTTVRMTIDTSGNVGIGTSSPTSPTSVTTFLAIEGTTAGIVLSDTGHADYKWDIWNSSGGLFMKYNNTTFGVCQLSSGQVGIGVTTPAAKLQIGSNVDPAQIAESLVHLLSPTASSTVNGFTHLKLDYHGGAAPSSAGAQIMFNQSYHSGNTDYTQPTGSIRGWKTGPDYNYGGGLQLLYQPDAGALGVLVGMTLTGDGYVGIGTDSPDELLHLYKASGNAGLEIEAVSAGDPLIRFVSANNRTGDLYYTDATTLARFSYDHSAIAFKMYAHNNSSVDFYVSETEAYFTQQDVGIGTTSPSTLLNLEKSVDAFQALLIESTATYPAVSNAAGSRFQNSSGSLYMFVDNGGGDYGPTGGTGAASAYAGNFRLTGAYPLQFATSDTLRMTIDATGSVGINEKSPGTYYGDQLVIACPDENGITIMGTASNQKQYLCFASNSTGANAYAGYMAYDHNTNALSLATNGGSNALTIDNTQKAVFASEITSGDDMNCPTKIVIGEGAAPELRLKKTDAGYAKISFYNNPGSSAQVAYISLDAAEDFTYYGASGVDQVFYAGGVLNTTMSSATLTCAGDVVAFSDKKLKKNIKTLDGSKVYKMRGVSFDRIDTGKASSGVIAQEIQKIAPELISESNETLGVAYGNISGYLIEAIKELKAEIEELKQKPCNCNNCNCK
jgi:hypothetical protein